VKGHSPTGGRRGNHIPRFVSDLHSAHEVASKIIDAAKGPLDSTVSVWGFTFDICVLREQNVPSIIVPLKRSGRGVSAFFLPFDI